MNHQTSSPIISIEKVSFGYSSKYQVLKDINLDIYESDFIALIGPNGGGKSTLIKLIIGILPLQKGSIKLFGKALSQFKNWSCLGYVSQKATHFDSQFPVTVWEIVSMALASKKGFFQRLSEFEKKIINQALDEVEMLAHKNTPLNELSGGQQQRVFIARALAGNPCILVLDEPTIGVDIHSQEQFYSLLQKLRKEKHLTIILISHDIGTSAHQATKFACLNQELIYHGDPKGFSSEENLKKLYGKNANLIHHDHH